MSEADTTARRGALHPLLGVAVVLLLLPLGLAAARSYQDLAQARERQAELERRIEETRAENARLERWIERLESDPFTIERLAREQLGMVRPGELVVLVEEPTPPTPPTPMPHTGEPE